MGDHFSGYPALSGLKGGSLPKFSKKNLLKVAKYTYPLSKKAINHVFYAKHQFEIKIRFHLFMWVLKVGYGGDDCSLWVVTCPVLHIYFQPE